MAVFRATLVPTASFLNTSTPAPPKKFVLEVADWKGEARKRIAVRYPNYTILDITRMIAHDTERI